MPSASRALDPLSVLSDHPGQDPPKKARQTCTTRPRPLTPRPPRCSAAESTVPRALRRYLALDDFEATARRRLPKFLYGYISGGAETDASVRDNRRASTNTVSCRGCSTTSPAASRPRKLFGKTYAAPFGIPPMGSSALCAYRGDIVLTRAAGRDEPADDSERLIPDHAGGCAARKPGRLVSGLPRRRAFAHRAVGRPRRGGRLRHVCRYRRRAGAAEPRKQYPQRISGPARDHAAVGLGHREPSALAVRHLGAHAEKFRHAAFREHGRQARTAGAGQKPDAQYRPPRPARLEACRADPQALEGQARGKGPDLAGGCAHRARKRRRRRDGLQPCRPPARLHRVGAAHACRRSQPKPAA